MGFVLLMSAKLGKFSDELLPPSCPISCVSDSLIEPLMTNLSCFFFYLNLQHQEKSSKKPNKKQSKKQNCIASRCHHVY